MEKIVSLQRVLDQLAKCCDQIRDQHSLHLFNIENNKTFVAKHLAIYNAKHASNPMRESAFEEHMKENLNFIMKTYNNFENDFDELILIIVGEKSITDVDEIEEKYLFNVWLGDIYGEQGLDALKLLWKDMKQNLIGLQDVTIYNRKLTSQSS